MSGLTKDHSVATVHWRYPPVGTVRARRATTTFRHFLRAVIDRSLFRKSRLVQ
jgi:hypothetical protein